MDTIKIKIETNAESASKSFEGFDESLKKTTNDAQDLRKEIKGLKSDLFKLEPGTVEYTKKIQELGAKMDQYSDTMLEARAATGQLDTVFQATTKATASLAGGFSAAIGVVTLFGKDSENLMKTMVKLQAAMNIAKGLNEFAAFPKMLDRMAISIEAYADTLGASAATASAEAVALGADTASTTANAAAKVAATTTTLSNSAAVVQNTETVTTNTLASNANIDAVNKVAVVRTILNAALEKGMITELQYNAILEKMTANIYAQAAAGEKLNEQKVVNHTLNLAEISDMQAANLYLQSILAAKQGETVATKAETAASAENTAAKEANTVASNANANAHIKNAAALQQEALAEKESAAGSVTLASGFKRFGKAIISLVTTPIGMIILALAGLTAAFVTVGKKQKEAIELNEKYADSIAQLPPPIENVEQALQKYMTALDEYDKKLQAIGISEERRSEVRLEAMEKQRDKYEQELKNISLAVKTLENQIDEYYQTIDDGGSLLSDEADAAVAMASAGTEKWSNELKALKERAIETNEALQKVNEELRQLASQQLPESVRALNQALSDLNDQFRVSIAGGIATNGDQIKAQIQLYKDAYNDLFSLAGGMYRIKGDTQDEQRINQELATKYQNEIKKLELDLAVYNAGLAKKASDSAKQAAKTLNSNFEKLVKDIDVKVAGYVSAWEKAFNRFAEIGKYADSDMILPEQSLGRALTELNRYGMDVTAYITEWKENAKKALDAGEISQSLYDKLLKKIASSEESMRNSIAALNKSGISDAIFNQGKNIQDMAEEFRKQNETLLDALSGGLVTPEEYENYLESRLTEYRAKVGPEIEKALSMINEEVANAAPEKQEQLRKILESYINLTDDVLPPEVMQNINSVITESIDKRFDEIEKAFEGRKDRFAIYWEDMNRSWLEGGQNTSYWGDSASASFNKMQKQAEDLYKLLHEEYTQEAAAITEKMHLLDENSEAYKQYFQKLADLRQADADAQAQYETSTVANARQYGQNIIATTQQFTDSISGLASALGSYYAEQKDAAAEMYGENSAEYQKYLKKEGNMKIAQVWIDWATGVMSAWATSETLGPIAGPILAAIQTAALTATAVASTQQIKRQSKASNNGGGTTANVGQLTDRVIYGDAQNANQQAELNGMYNQGATRVYVTQGDIQDANNDNRVAVTQNRF